MNGISIFLLYPYYWPHFKAGGPVQSLYNLVGLFKGKARFYLVSHDRDIDGHSPTDKIEIGVWTKGPFDENIYFAPLSSILVFRLIRQVSPDIILVNGMFNLETTLPGILHGRLSGTKMILSPRGMLQPWALSRNKIVKKSFLYLLRLFLRKNERWHATTPQERNEILENFGRDQKVAVASNIPRTVSIPSVISFPDARRKIRLVFLSLINRNKNLHLIIREVCRWDGKFALDIYGPVIDEDYWQICENSITRLQDITYKGPALPWVVPSILAGYHFFILPTQGENFGHAIFDALAAGIPVIISRTTPWMKIEESGAGFYLDLEDEDSMKHVFEKIDTLTQEDYNELRRNSTQYASNYWKSKDYQQEYKFLFD